jgi:soluble lytic murein transglycosylase-like protein
MTRAEFMLLGVVLVAVATPSLAGAMGQRTPLEQVDCRIIEEAARANLIPAGLLTHLLWTESRFQADAVSPKGALGVAQFMPETADERWLSDPFDPDLAIPESARFLADLKRQFGIPGWRSRRTMQAVSA